MRVTLKILLTVAVFVLVYMCYRSIMSPIEFNDEQAKREKAIEQRLIDIRKAQIEYKNVHKVHAKTFEELENFLSKEKLPFLIKEGSLTDEQLESGLTEREAVKKGIIKRDTVWIPAVDTILGKGYDITKLGIVPGTNKTFEMDTASIKSSSGYTVAVFQASVKYDDYLGDLNKQLLINLNHKAEKLKRFPGLCVGSIKEINNNAGNWE